MDVGGEVLERGSVVAGEKDEIALRQRSSVRQQVRINNMGKPSRRNLVGVGALVIGPCMALIWEMKKAGLGSTGGLELWEMSLR